MVRFDVLGTPVPKGSMRAILRGGFPTMVPGGDNDTQKRLATWDQSVREAARTACTLAAGYELTAPVFVDCPVRVMVTFRLRRPKGHWGKAGVKPSAPHYPAVKPDVDKLARAALDALTGVAFADDQQVVELMANKAYANPGDEGASFLVEAVDG